MVKSIGKRLQVDIALVAIMSFVDAVLCGNNAIGR